MQQTDDARPAAGGSRGRRAVVWLLILLAAAVMIFDNRWSVESRGSAVPRELDFDLQSRYIVGYVHWFGSSLGAFQRAASIAQVRAVAKTPNEKVCLAAVIGEIQSREDALRYLKKLQERGLAPAEAADARLLERLERDGSASLDQAQRAKVQRDLGWCGDLALSRDLPPSDPLRARTIRAGDRTFALVLASVLLCGLFVLVGVALLILFSVLFFDGSLRPRLRRPGPSVADALLEGFAAYLLGMALLALTSRWLARLGIAANVLLIVPIGLSLIWLWLRGLRWEQFTQSVGWYRGRGVAREAGSGIVGYIAGLPLVAIGLILSLAIVRWTHSAMPSHPIVRAVHASFPVQLFVLFLACVFAPITEELVFRGMLLGHLRLRHGWFASAALTSLIFAAIHPQGWTTIPVLGAIAMVLAALREQRGSLIASMTAHAMNNGLVMFILFFALR